MSISIAELVQISIAPQTVLGQTVVQDIIELSEYDHRAFRALICNLTGVGITKINRAARVGKVYSFDVSPFQRRDPTLVVCAEMNLEKYYEIWSSAVVRGLDDWNNSEYMEAMRTAVRSARTLSREEVVFATIEMLHFQNEVMCR